MTIHISEQTRRLVLARGGRPAVEPDKQKWLAAERTRRRRQEAQERAALDAIPRWSSKNLERAHRLHESRPWLEKPPPIDSNTLHFAHFTKVRNTYLWPDSEISKNVRCVSNKPFSEI